MAKDKSELVLKVGMGAILLVALLFMFVFNPHENFDKFSNETMWEMVHPFSFFDGIATIGLIGFAAFLSGWLGKYLLSAGQAKFVGIAGFAIMFLFLL